jgi:hypothetical protein
VLELLVIAFATDEDPAVRLESFNNVVACHVVYFYTLRLAIQARRRENFSA